MFHTPHLSFSHLCLNSKFNPIINTRTPDYYYTCTTLSRPTPSSNYNSHPRPTYIQQPLSPIPSAAIFLHHPNPLSTIPPSFTQYLIINLSIPLCQILSLIPARRLRLGPRGYQQRHLRLHHVDPWRPCARAHGLGRAVPKTGEGGGEGGWLSEDQAREDGCGDIKFQKERRMSGGGEEWAERREGEEGDRRRAEEERKIRWED